MQFIRHAVALVALVVFVQQSANATEPDSKIQELQGSWQLESIERAGAKVNDRSAAGRVMLIGGRSAIVRQGGAIFQVVMLQANAVGDQKYLNMSVLQGPESGAIQLGIYQIKDDVLTICYDGEGINRPTEFKTAAGTKQVLAMYKKRIPRGNERKGIAGNYKTTNEDDAGKITAGEAIVEKQGDAYSVIYKHGAGVAFVGIGIRDGDTLSVSWRNQLQSGLSVYKIGSDGKMVGKCVLLGGNGAIHSESLQPDNEF